MRHVTLGDFPSAQSVPLPDDFAEKSPAERVRWAQTHYGDESPLKLAERLGVDYRQVIRWRQAQLSISRANAAKFEALTGVPAEAWRASQAEWIEDRIREINAKLDRVLSLLERDEGAAVDDRPVGAAKEIVEAVEQRDESVSREGQEPA